MANWTPQQLQQMAALLAGTHDTLSGLPQPAPPQPQGEERLQPGWPWQQGSETALGAIEGVSPQQWAAGPPQAPQPSLPPPVMAYAPQQQSAPPQAAGAPHGPSAAVIAQVLMGKPPTSAQRYADANERARSSAIQNSSNPTDNATRARLASTFGFD